MDAATTAKSVRTEIWEPRGFPVDPAWIAHQMGLRVLDADLPDKVSGALVKETGEDPVILLNRTDSKNRKRFSCAHELGHYAFRMANGADHYEYIDFRDEESGAGINSEEIFANRFAAELLMPTDEVKRLHQEGKPSLLIARYFGVSDDAIRIRFKTLGLPR
jgi:Zn-dependent peptidase ImmA (M78 family)